MRPLLREVQEIDRYLLHEMKGSGKLVFEARMLLSPALREKVRCQQQAHEMIRLAGRAAQRERLCAVYDTLMEDPDFNSRIAGIFR